MRSLFISRGLVESGLWIVEKELPMSSLRATDLRLTIPAGRVNHRCYSRPLNRQSTFVQKGRPPMRGTAMVAFLLASSFGLPGYAVPQDQPPKPNIEQQLRNQYQLPRVGANGVVVQAGRSEERRVGKECRS